MNHPFNLFICLLFTIACSLPTKGEQPTQEEAALSLLFNTYKEALSQKDGRKAAEIINPDTEQVYEYYKEGALAGTKSEILQLPLIHQAGILILRGSIPPEELLNMSGKDVYAASIENGLIANKWSNSMELLQISIINPKTAILSIGVKDQGGTRLPATKEGNNWKFSLREILMQSNSVIEKLLKEKNITQEQYLQSVIESQLGEGSFQKIWEPPASRIRKAMRPEKNEDVLWVEKPK